MWVLIITAYLAFTGGPGDGPITFEKKFGPFNSYEQCIASQRNFDKYMRHLLHPNHVIAMSFSCRNSTEQEV